MITDVNLQKDIKGGLNVEQLNIADKLDDDELKKIGKKIFYQIEDDKKSRMEWERKHAEWKRIYDQSDKPVNRPWMGSSTESIPIMTEACNGFQARAYKALFPSRNFISAMPVGTPDQNLRERAERVARHMSFQLAVVDKNYKRDKNAMLLAIGLNGSDFSKVFYDPLIKANVVERVRAVDLIVPYTIGKKRIEEVERKTHVIYMTENEGFLREKIGFFIKAPTKYRMGSYGNLIQQEEDKKQGLLQQEWESNYCMVYECHCLLDLDDNKIAEPYIVWLDAQTQDVLRIQIRYEIDETGQPTDYKKPVEYFTHFYFLENPDGFYGLGYGHLIGDLNIACNKMLRMCIDASELANTASGFINENMDIKGGEVEMQIGKFQKVSTPISDIASGIYQMQFPGAHPALVSMLQAVEGYARRLSSATDVAAGDFDKVVQPMSMMTMLEQSLQMPTSVMEQLSMSLEDEFDKIYKLNQKYLQQESYYVDGDKIIPITKEDYVDDLRVFPIFDPRSMTKQQKISKAQALFQFVTQNPILSQNPDNILNVSKQVLESMEIEDVDALIQPPPPPPEPPQPQQIDDPTQENTQFLMPPDQRALIDVFPDQDHVAHLQAHNQLLQGPNGQDLLPDAAQALQMHMQKHKALIYQQQVEMEKQNAARGFGNMAAQQGDQGSLQQAGGPLQGGQEMGGMQQLAGIGTPERGALSFGLSPQDIGRGSGSVLDNQLPPEYFRAENPNYRGGAA